jgi:CRISPR-associated protein (TIGR02710 family)
MAQWDAFNHADAAERAQKEAAVAAALRGSGHLDPLRRLGEREKGKPGLDICADLWLNALRRGERGRFDDALARLYRLLEAAAQTRVLSRYGLDTGRVPLNALPDALRSSVYLKTDPKDGTEYAQWGLNHSVEFLHHRDPDDAFAKMYGSGSVSGERLQGPPWLVKRNNSILAHGFVSVDHRAWEEARGWVERHLVPFLGDAVFPQLPRDIPPLLEDAL